MPIDHVEVATFSCSFYTFFDRNGRFLIRPLQCSSLQQSNNSSNWHKIRSYPLNMWIHPSLLVCRPVPIYFGGVILDISNINSWQDSLDNTPVIQIQKPDSTHRGYLWSEYIGRELIDLVFNNIFYFLTSKGREEKIIDFWIMCCICLDANCTTECLI